MTSLIDLSIDVECRKRFVFQAMLMSNMNDAIDFAEGMIDDQDMERTERYLAMKFDYIRLINDPELFNLMLPVS